MAELPAVALSLNVVAGPVAPVMVAELAVVELLKFSVPLLVKVAVPGEEVLKKFMNCPALLPIVEPLADELLLKFNVALLVICAVPAVALSLNSRSLPLMM